MLLGNGICATLGAKDLVSCFDKTLGQVFFKKGNMMHDTCKEYFINYLHLLSRLLNDFNLLL